MEHKQLLGCSQQLHLSQSLIQSVIVDESWCLAQEQHSTSLRPSLEDLEKKLEQLQSEWLGDVIRIHDAELSGSIQRLSAKQGLNPCVPSRKPLAPATRS